MKKRIYSVLLSLLMVVSSTAGSLKFEALNGLTNLNYAYAAENGQGALRTKLNKTLLFADDEAFNAEVERVKNTVLPELEKSAEKLDTAEDVLNWLKHYDETGRAVSKLLCYGDVGTTLDGSDTKAYEQYNTALNLNKSSSEINMAAIDKLLKNDEAFLKGLLSNESLKPWTVMLNGIINGGSFDKNDAYMLAPAQEAESSYYNIYDTLINTDLKYETLKAPDGKDYEANLVNTFSVYNEYQDYDFQMKVQGSYFQSLKNYENTFAALLNGYISSSESLAKRYGYSSVLEMSMAEEGITGDVLLNMIKSARQNRDIFDRYMYVEDKSHGYDIENPDVRYEPVYEVPDEDFDFQNTRNILVKALAPLGDEYIAVLNKAFDEGWIDAYPDKNKFQGNQTTGYSGVVPCVIVNYTNDYEGLTMLAHELGHAVHDYLSQTNQQSYYAGQSTLFEAEIASLTNEVLLARYMQDNAKTDKERMFYLMQEFSVYNMNYFGTILDSDFESEIRDIVNNGGVLTADVLDSTFDRILHVYYPGSLYIENRDVSWAYITQMYKPYYSKSYAFAVTAAANAANNILSGDSKAISDYQTFLKSGRSLSPDKLYALAGTDLTNPAFVQPFYDRCNKIIEESGKIVDANIVVKN